MMNSRFPRLRLKLFLFLLIVVIFLTGGTALWRRGMQKYNQVKNKMNALLANYNAEKETRQRLKKFEEDVTVTLQRLVQYGTAPPGILIPAFIRHVEALAAEEGVRIAGITPKPQIEAYPMIKTPFEIEISGEFAPIHRFLARIEKSLLPIQIEEILMIEGEDKILEVSLASYVLSAKENPENFPKASAAHAVFKSEPIGKDDLTLEKGRDLFFYPPSKLPKEAEEKKETKKKKPAKKIKRKKRHRNAFETSRLSAIFYDGRSSMALLDGVFLSIGDTYKGHEVVAIQKNQVTLSNRKGSHKIVLKEE